VKTIRTRKILDDHISSRMMVVGDITSQLKSLATNKIRDECCWNFFGKREQI
jgi:hypothetical protein